MPEYFDISFIADKQQKEASEMEEIFRNEFNLYQGENL